MPASRPSGTSLPTAKRQKRAPMSVTEAEKLAAQEGLVLVPSSRTTQSGYWRVSAQGSHSNTFQCVGTVEGKKDANLGNFSTAVEAALAVARNLGQEGSKQAAVRVAMAEAAADRPPMGESEARRLADAEGLTLILSSFNKSGFLNVSKVGREGSKPIFQVTLSHNTKGESRGLGCYKTVFEAALTYARHLGPAGCAECVEAAERASANAKLREEEKAERVAAAVVAKEAREERKAERKAERVAAAVVDKEAREERKAERKAERVAAAVVDKEVRQRARERARMERDVEQAAAAAAAKEAKAKAKAKALADKAAQLDVEKAAKALSQAAAVARAKPAARAKEAKVTTTAKSKAGKAAWQRQRRTMAKTAKEREALEREDAAKLLLILPSV